MELTNRLRMNAELVPVGVRLADIGCDHGYVSIYLAKNKNCRVIAMDVREGPLSTARKNIAACGMSDLIECRLSDGLTELMPGEADTLLIAGMGGMLINTILQKDPAVLEEVQTLVLQPQSDLYEVRKCLFSLGFFIDREAFCVDSGKNYVAIRACRGVRRGEEEGHGQTAPYSEAELMYGRFLPETKDAGYREYLLNEKAKYESLLRNLKMEQSGGCQTRIPAIMHILDLLEQILW